MTPRAADTIDISTVILDLAKWKHGIDVLTADQSFDGWRHAQESDALRHVLMGARERAENLRFVAEPTRTQQLALLWNGLPVARLRQLVGDDFDGDQVA